MRHQSMKTFSDDNEVCWCDSAEVIFDIVWEVPKKIASISRTQIISFNDDNVTVTSNSYLAGVNNCIMQSRLKLVRDIDILRLQKADSYTVTIIPVKDGLIGVDLVGVNLYNIPAHKIETPNDPAYPLNFLSRRLISRRDLRTNAFSSQFVYFAEHEVTGDTNMNWVDPLEVKDNSEYSAFVRAQVYLYLDIKASAERSV